MSPLLYGVLLIWPLSEIVLILRERRFGGRGKRARSGSAWWVWTGVGLSVGLAMAAQLWAFPPLPIPSRTLLVAGLALVVAGVVFRLAAVATLGRFFRLHVTLEQGQQVVDRGLYRFLRHPSYTGSLLSFFGFGLLLGNWVSLALLMIPIVAVFLRRIRIEEAALIEALGSEYAEYRERTRRLIPGLY